MKNLRHLLKDSKAAQVAPPITSAGLTAEIVFVPESDALFPPGGRRQGTADVSSI